jgi:hypothetical protein
MAALPRARAATARPVHGGIHTAAASSWHRATAASRRSTSAVDGQETTSLRALIAAFDNSELDLEALRAFDRPVYFALGGISNPDYYARMAERLAAIFPDFTLETFPERHHFDPPHRIEPERLASSLLALWEPAEAD